MHEGNPVLKIQIGAMVHRRLVYIYLLDMPSFSMRYFNKIKRTSHLGRLLALSLEILYTNCFGHLTKMANMPIYDRSSLNISYSETKRPMSLGLGM